MADYARKKNDELAQLCKERGLAHTGKKADLVKRLEEYDAKQGAGVASDKPLANDDEIDWDDESTTGTAKKATNDTTANIKAAEARVQVTSNQAVPNQEAATEPAKADNLSSVSPQLQPGIAEGGKDFNSGMADRTLDEEIEKRKARLRKFGVSEQDEEWKKLERAQKFGNNEILGCLNKALSDEKPGGKRGRTGTVDVDDSTRKRSRGRPGAGKRQESDHKEKQNSKGGYPSWMSDADRAAAERRKAKFATAT